MSNDTRLYLFNVDLYVPLAVLEAAGVDIKLFHRWQELGLKTLGQSLKQVIPDDADERYEIEELCFEEMRAWSFYNDIQAPIIDFDLSLYCDRIGDDVTITLRLLGSTDKVASRAMAEQLFRDAAEHKLRPVIKESLIPANWGRPDPPWGEEPMSGYMLDESGEWVLDSDSNEFDRGTDGNLLQY